MVNLGYVALKIINVVIQLSFVACYIIRYLSGQRILGYVALNLLMTSVVTPGHVQQQPTGQIY